MRLIEVQNADKKLTVATLMRLLTDCASPYIQPRFSYNPSINELAVHSCWSEPAWCGTTAPVHLSQTEPEPYRQSPWMTLTSEPLQLAQSSYYYRRGVRKL